MFCHFGIAIFAVAGFFHASSVHISLSDEYDAFRKKHRSSPQEEDSVAYNHRLELYTTTKEKVEAHNALPGISWKKAINKYADWTEAEKKSQFGYKRVNLPKEVKAESLVARDTPPKAIAASADWTKSSAPVTGSRVKDQGNCGSCWAVSSIGALEMFNEVYNNNTASLSWGELVDCVTNPGICGGSGGCDGATAELAFAYVARNGLSTSNSYKGSGHASSVGSVPSSSCKPGKGGYPAGGSFVRLTENVAAELMLALSNTGPVVVSVDASTWNEYGSGIMGGDANGCGAYREYGQSFEKRVTVNHAVLAVGFGHDDTLGKDYWLIRNSWGPDWGEAGFIRIERTGTDDNWCGTDTDPFVGVGCKGNAAAGIARSPDSLRVCGMCGILSDSSYPCLSKQCRSSSFLEKDTVEEATVNPSGSIMMRSEPKN